MIKFNVSDFRFSGSNFFSHSSSSSSYVGLVVRARTCKCLICTSIYIIHAGSASIDHFSFYSNLNINQACNHKIYFVSSFFSFCSLFFILLVQSFLFPSLFIPVHDKKIIQAFTLGHSQFWPNTKWC